MPSYTPTRFRTTLIAYAVAAGLCFAAPHLVRGQAAPTEAPKAAAAAPVDVPVKAVVLFSSGVGYFEHFGNVTGDGAAEIRFKTAQINDVLKSLVVQDLDGGKAGTVSYASQEPLDRTLKSFQVDITQNPSLSDLLNQLRGATLAVTLPGGNKEKGLILGVEHRTNTTAGAPGEPAKTETRAFLNLKIGRRVRAIPLEDAQEWQLEDPQLDAELDKALAALSGARGQDKKPVTINFRGQGDRRVRLGYVVEAPIWKTSYRLVLSDPAGGADPKRPQGAEASKANNGAANAHGGGYLQGWAIVENQTDNDWDNVQLSLVSGRPISFIQDLYNPLYIPRPIVRPELYASLRPQTYEGGISDEKAEEMREKADASQEKFRDAPTFGLDGESTRGHGGGQALFGNSGGGERDKAKSDNEEPIDPTASVRSVASAGKIGELFQYTVGNVSIARQKSAMIPIVTEPLQVEKLSIFNATVLPQHPLNGARVKNTTKNHLLQGPITVLEAGSYAGDAQIDDLPPGQERLISYGVDLDTHVVVEPEDDPAQSKGQILTAKINNGTLEVTQKYVHGWTYTAENKGAADKTLLIEHPKIDEEPRSSLVEPAKADETTQTLYRFSRLLKAGGSLKFRVRIEQIALQGIELTNARGDSLAEYVSSGAIPKPVLDALAKAADLNRTADRAATDASNLRRRVQDIRKEQANLRENMKAVAQGTDYYNRLAAKLDAQETEVEKLQSQADSAEQKRDAAVEEFNKFVKGLNVG